MPSGWVPAEPQLQARALACSQGRRPEGTRQRQGGPWSQSISAYLGEPCGLIIEGYSFGPGGPDPTALVGDASLLAEIRRLTLAKGLTAEALLSVRARIGRKAIPVGVCSR